MLLVPYLISVHGWNGTERMFSQLQVPWPSHWAISTSHGHIKSIMDTVFNFNSIVALFRKLRFNNASYFVYYKLLTMLGILLTFFFFFGSSRPLKSGIWKPKMTSCSQSLSYRTHFFKLQKNKTWIQNISIIISSLHSILWFWSILIILSKLIFANVWL